jgi:hexokinase
METMGCIPKLEHLGLDPNLEIAINCEWGAFDNEKAVLPLTAYDIHVDKNSPRCGQQLFEKMVAGLYLGELFRLVLVDLHANPDVRIFENQNISALKIEYSLDASFLAEVERLNNPFLFMMRTVNIV